MKKDVLGIAALVFVVGMIFSSFDIKEFFVKEAEPPAEFQQGFAVNYQRK